jgi:prolyl oligopeptidase
VLQAQPGFEAMRSRHPRGAGLARADPGGHAPRRLVLQPVADAGQPARPVAAHHAGRVPQGPAGLGNGDRPGRPGQGREGKLGLGRRHLPGPRYRRCLVRCRAAAPTPRWCANSTCVDKRFVAGGLRAARSQERRRLARRRHVYVAPTSARARSPIRATRASSSAGSAAQPLADAHDRVRSRPARTCRLRQRGPHARLRAHRTSAATPASTQPGSPAAGGKQVAHRQADDAKLRSGASVTADQLRSDWTVAAAPGRAAACWWPTPAFLASRASRFTALFTPTATRSLDGYTTRAAATCCSTCWTTWPAGWRSGAPAPGPAGTARREVKAPYPGHAGGQPRCTTPAGPDDPLAESYC